MLVAVIFAPLFFFLLESVSERVARRDVPARGAAPTAHEAD